MEQTLIIIKPDGVRKGLTESEVIGKTSFNIVKSKRVRATIEQARLHYAEHDGRPFFDRITNALTTDDIIVMIVEGQDAIKLMRYQIGRREDPDSIRGKYSNPNVPHENGIHASDSAEAAAYEISVWFS